MTAGIKANVDGSAAIQVGGVDAITLTSAGAASFVTSPMTIQGGSAAAPSLTFSGDTNTGIFSPAADTIAIGTGGTEALRVNSSQSLLLNTTSAPAASAKMKIATSARTGAFFDLTATGGENWIIDSTNTTGSTDVLGIYANGATGLYLQDNGNVGIGTTSPSAISTYTTLDIRGSSGGGFRYGSSTAHGYLYSDSSGSQIGSATNHPLLFYTNGTERMRLLTSGILQIPVAYSTTTGSAANLFIDAAGGFYRSTSSIKYKTDVQDASHGLAEVMQLRAVTYKSKGEFDGDTVFGGLIAEEVHDAGLTEFVQYAEDGTPDALAYGHMVSLCIKALQELKAELDATKAEVALLKGAA